MMAELYELYAHLSHILNTFYLETARNPALPRHTRTAKIAHVRSLVSYFARFSPKH